MKYLDHPFKRASFLFFLLSMLLSTAFALLPTPLEFSGRYKDAVPGEAVDKTVARIDINCADALLGGPGVFAREFQLVEIFVADRRPYIVRGSPSLTAVIREARFSSAMEGRMMSDGPLSLSKREAAKASQFLRANPDACIEGVCIENLNEETFRSIMDDCSTLVGLHLHKGRSYWRIDKNLEYSAPWSYLSIIGVILFFLLSVAYGKTIGAIIRWIKTGTV